MASRKRARVEASDASTVVLAGGPAEKPLTIEKFRTGKLTDVEVKAADGTASRADAVFLGLGLPWALGVAISGAPVIMLPTSPCMPYAPPPRPLRLGNT